MQLSVDPHSNLLSSLAMSGVAAFLCGSVAREVENARPSSSPLQIVRQKAGDEVTGIFSKLRGKTKVEGTKKQKE